MKKLLLIAAILASAGFVRAQVPPAAAPVPQPSDEENTRIFAGTSYLQQVDPEVKQAIAKVNELNREFQMKLGLAQAEADIVMYTKLKAFDAKVAKIADAKIAEAQQRKDVYAKQLEGK